MLTIKMGENVVRMTYCVPIGCSRCGDKEACFLKASENLFALLRKRYPKIKTGLRYLKRIVRIRDMDAWKNGSERYNNHFIIANMKDGSKEILVKLNDSTKVDCSNYIR